MHVFDGPISLVIDDIGGFPFGVVRTVIGQRVTELCNNREFFDCFPDHLTYLLQLVVVVAEFREHGDQDVFGEVNTAERLADPRQSFVEGRVPGKRAF
jgi:hypothetical protein